MALWYRLAVPSCTNLVGTLSRDNFAHVLLLWPLSTMAGNTLTQQLSRTDLQYWARLTALPGRVSNRC
ncbi:hypothetical protein Cenrod_1879 [Candidatus Symbiobacter mobilis CR]|uniref:Uncharacterized protein n=1 Tax=Candidatus Symbiobacter mobilis CR TaxID=946483 RepID=U5NCR7_9BURK|nr:hypothetical protein Cenrod_1879 [Candidatus Symbiobacter mobilis CR]